MKSLIDGDIVIFRCGWASENDSPGIACARTDEMMNLILDKTGAKDYSMFLSDRKENNFRYKVYPQYKANREGQPRPRHLELLKEHVITEWAASIAHNQEADDALGIGQDKVGFSTIICSIDKDLLTIPGLHFNFVKQEMQTVSPMGALVNFYAQFLIGDKADNIMGCAGIGPVKSAKILAPCETEEEMFEAVVNTFLSVSPDKSPDEILTHILQIGRVLKIRTEEDEPLWTFPKSKLMGEIGQLFTLQTEEEIGPSTELTTMEPSGM